MRIPYLVIINNEESFVYTDKRKIKKIFNENENIKVYMFKNIDRCNNWKEVYEIFKNDDEIKVEIFESNEYIYSDLGIYIMENIARAEWNSSIKYPNNGWHICSVCGDITNEIEDCSYCGDPVCWDCSNTAVNNHWIENKFCSYDCYRMYLEDEYGIEYNPESEYEEKICNRLEYILEHFDKEQLINILLHVESYTYNYDENELDEEKLKYNNMTEREVLNELNCKCDSDIYDTLMDLYEKETDEYLSDILDGEAFINSLDPNDPADEWFFED